MIIDCARITHDKGDPANGIAFIKFKIVSK